MTFKHIDFADSETMRSLERLAVKKGLCKPEEIKKTAAIDLFASSNLTQNILNLCSGLRASGMNKYAEEIEQKYIYYKKAQTLYDVSKETGEDLIDAAHPNGSHKLRDVDSDEAVIETVIDQHLAAIKMLDKKP